MAKFPPTPQSTSPAKITPCLRYAGVGAKFVCRICMYTKVKNMTDSLRFRSNDQTISFRKQQQQKINKMVNVVVQFYLRNMKSSERFSSHDLRFIDRPQKSVNDIDRCLPKARSRPAFHSAGLIPIKTPTVGAIGHRRATRLKFFGGGHAVPHDLFWRVQRTPRLRFSRGWGRIQESVECFSLES